VLLRELDELRERLRAAAPPDSRHRPPCTTLNTGRVEAGTADNVVPDRARVSLEWRPLPGEDAAALRAAVQAALERACAARPGVAGTLRWPDALPAFHQPPDHALVRFCEQASGQASGVVPFYTEAELYRGGLLLPTVVCGPGSIAQAHRVDESILFDELEAGADFYSAAIAHFCG
jgi:acetylornithine deacetylase